MINCDYGQILPDTTEGDELEIFGILLDDPMIEGMASAAIRESMSGNQMKHLP